MDRFEALNTFVEIAEHGSFAGAARALGQSPAKMTRTIAALEAHLGVTLFHRSTRTVALSHEGAALLERARGLLADLREAEHLVMGRGGAPQGELRVTAPVLFGRMHVLPVVAGLLASHAGLSARMLLLNRNVRIVEEGIDVAVRIGELTDSTLMRVQLGAVRQVIVASPGYLDQRGMPKQPADLARHDCIDGSSIRPDNVWRFGQDKALKVEVQPRLVINDIAARIAAAEAGAGVVNVLSYQVAGALRAGRLVSLLDDQAPPALPVQLLYHSSRAAMPAVRAFIEAMRERASRDSWRANRW
ncbi:MULTISPECIES: LysR family transcriptional regulator [Novosphingobium]|uniref:Transcriptional regulator, LysR family n=1 Tax=Novosphingobium mathurense TaxID=428990 RepID=A0A1U6I1V2_9SPHN|nr:MULTISPECIES: LysR family transcriptional regulator [Novosphingobium]CDO38434.1 putative transcriptional regulator, LysR family [Novosphingobium sp. KN65.2]SLK01984.1 transcriptional regulator, LysR family [Novosphingobium mathurense]